MLRGKYSHLNRITNLFVNAVGRQSEYEFIDLHILVSITFIPQLLCKLKKPVHLASK